MKHVQINEETIQDFSCGYASLGDVLTDKADTASPGLQSGGRGWE